MSVEGLLAVARGEAEADLLLTRDAREVIHHPMVDVVVETIGGTTIAREFVLEALKAGKDVVTANKALLSEYAPEIFGTALKTGRRIQFEGAVCGGIPLIETLDGPLSSSQINSVWGILNGTCNYILTKMEEGAGSFQNVLAEAQKLGYAEKDPTLDIGGFDTAHKIALLASICFSQKIEYSQISIEGIERVEEMDVQFAAHNGYQVKLLGIARKDHDHVDVRVHPALVSHDNLLSHVRDVYNAVYLAADPAGGILLYGRGAGSMPTGSAVVSDLIQMARGENKDPWRAEVFCRAGLKQLQLDRVENHFYVRCGVNDTPTALNDVASVLARHHISLDMAERVESGGLKVVALTSKVKRRTVNAALKSLETAPFVSALPYAIAVEEVGEWSPESHSQK